MKRKFFALLLSASMIISSGVIPTFAADKVSSLDTVNGETLINERGIEEVSNTNISPYFMDKATKKPATATFSLVGKTVNQSAKTMTIDLKLTNAEQGLAGVKARVDYSNLSTYITNATVKTGINSGIEISENANIITLTKAVSENIPTDSILATLTFNIKDDYYDVVAKSGKLALTIVEAAYIDMSETSGEQAKPIEPTNISAVDGDVVIEPWDFVLGNTDSDIKVNLQDVINTLVEVNRDINNKRFLPWQKASTNVILEPGDNGIIVSNPTANDAQAILEAVHYERPLIRK